MDWIDRDNEICMEVKLWISNKLKINWLNKTILSKCSLCWSRSNDIFDEDIPGWDWWMPKDDKQVPKLINIAIEKLKYSMMYNMVVLLLL